MKKGIKMEAMRNIDARDTDIGEYLREMACRTRRNNSLTGKINAMHGNIRVVMFIEDDKDR